jgi:hypothetical protein
MARRSASFRSACRRWAAPSDCLTCICTIIFDCVTRGLRISSCAVGGNSSPNHMSGARCAVKNFSGGKGHHLLASSETTLLVVMADSVSNTMKENRNERS